MELAGKRVVVVGLGKSGVAAAKLCLARGAHVVGTDSAPAEKISVEARALGIELVLGGVFVIEAASVVTQVTSYKLFGKRVFLMAPIHHHFEKKGWPEPRIIVRFWIISVLLALVALSSLKLR